MQDYRGKVRALGGAFLGAYGFGLGTPGENAASAANDANKATVGAGLDVSAPKQPGLFSQPPAANSVPAIAGINYSYYRYTG